MYEYRVDVSELESQNNFILYVQIEAESEEDAKDKITFVFSNECDVLSITESN